MRLRGAWENEGGVNSFLLNKAVDGPVAPTVVTSAPG